ncbi:MAG: cell division protein FtsA [Candidatus Liptonbacteria bacterium RIFCSPHIGHO2_01_FULL_57_28]|uniref:Cell division protein FtsA n=1 Tax=Candidatus Liptonbacteria bacterium RIFCSPHIGHO2_01_FULL_57_28 TaxID=1798647 RepID=A0A1G2C929_9BACT|nr:MAG: cell division protein FtsA [Candidatus Liptonbacteria bacterium RIFCSPHIGHO2_01_FULL_57_28]
MSSRYILGLDIGTSSIKTCLVERGQGRVAVSKVSKERSAGLRKGTVSDLGEAVPAVSRVFEDLKKISRAAIRNIYVNVGTPQVKVQSSKGIVAVSRVDNEIYQDDIERVVKASQAVSLSPNRMVIHTITREFLVDGVGDIASPLGLSGSRLEVVSMVVDSFTPHMKSLMRLVEMSGGEIGGLVFNPLAGARAALTKGQKELGSVFIDIGAGTTSMAVYEENKLLALQIFPVGGASITNDIAVGLKIPVAVAEDIKLQCGHALAREVPSKEIIELGKYLPGAKNTVSRRFVAEVIESRLAEILEFVNNELKLIQKSGNLAGGVVFAGGTAKLPGLAELAKQELRLSSHIGSPDLADIFGEGAAGEFQQLEDPEFATALGLVLGGGDQEGWWQTGEPRQSLMRFDLKKFIRNFLP